MKIDGLNKSIGGKKTNIGKRINNERLPLVANTEDSKLKVFEFDWLDGDEQFDISHLSLEILTRALLKLDLDKFDLYMLKFSPEQIISLFIKIRDSNLKITRLSLNYEQDLSQVPPQLMASAFSRLESVELNSAESVGLISAEQLSAIFTMLLSQELAGSKLKSLNFFYFEEGLSTISPDVLVEGIRRLEKFELLYHYSALTAEQINAILSAVTEGRQGMLKTIKIKMLNEDILGLETVSQTLLESAKQVKDLLEIEFD